MGILVIQQRYTTNRITQIMNFNQETLHETALAVLHHKFMSRDELAVAACQAVAAAEEQGLSLKHLLVRWL